MKNVRKMLFLLCVAMLLAGICTTAMAVTMTAVQYDYEFAEITVYHPVNSVDPTGGVPVSDNFDFDNRPVGGVTWYWDDESPICTEEEGHISDSRILDFINQKNIRDYTGHYVYPVYTIDGERYNEHGSKERWVLFPAESGLPQCIANGVRGSNDSVIIEFGESGDAAITTNIRAVSNDPSKTLVYQWDVYSVESWDTAINDEKHQATYQTLEGRLVLSNADTKLAGRKLRIRCSLGYQENPGKFTDGGSFMPLNVFIPVVMEAPDATKVAGVPETLKEIPKVEATANVKTQEDFEALMVDLTVENTRASGSSDYEIEVKDVVPKKWVGNDWVKITSVNDFPKEGVRVLLPWPTGENYVTMQGKTVYVAHMFTEACNGYDAGYVEYPAADMQPEGIYVTLMGMSPVSIYWEDTAAADPISYAAASTPKTGDNSHLMLWAGLMIAAACGMVVISRKRMSAER